MERVTYENDRGQTIDLLYSLPYFFQGIEGIDGLNTNIEKFIAVGQDGTNISSVRLLDRPIRLSGAIKGNTKEEIVQYRNKLLTVFNPKSKGTLVYEYGDVIRKIDCHVETGPVFKKMGMGFQLQEFIIDLICPNPFLTDYNDTEINAISGASAFSFPVAITPTFRFGYFNVGGFALQNDGDVECPLEIIIFGPQASPLEILNSATGEKIVVVLNLTADEKLTITTALENINVIKTTISTGISESAFQYIDVSQSEFFQLQLGINNIVIKANASDIGSATLKFRNRYVGV